MTSVKPPVVARLWLPGFALGYAAAFVLCPARQSFNVREQMKALANSDSFESFNNSLGDNVLNVREQMKALANSSLHEWLGDSADKLKPSSANSFWDRSVETLGRRMTGEMAALVAGPTRIQSLFGVALLAEVPLPEYSYYWIGCLGHWMFLGMAKNPSEFP